MAFEPWRVQSAEIADAPRSVVTIRHEAQMARWPRIVAPSYPVHVTQRGHNRDVTFYDAQDFANYRNILLRAAARTSCAIHAYALMSNHIHLLLTPPSRVGLSRLMQTVGSRFVRYWNRRHQRTGTLWDGRFKSSLVDTDRYFLACSRYIDLNPVRAGIVQRAESYEWSSHRHLAHGAADGLIQTHVAYDVLGATARLRQVAYAEFCAERTQLRATNALRSAIQRGAAGDARFLAQVEALLQRPTQRRAHGGDRRSEQWHASAIH
jgi:putative transposase